MLTYKDLDKSYSEIEKFCLGKFQANEDLFKTTVKDNIERYRKGKVTVTLKDENGNPLSGVKVRATLKKHEFKHGAHIFMLDQFETEEENKEYRELFPKYFNLATVPFYWKDLEPEEGKPRYNADSVNIYRRPSPDLCIDFCRKNGIDPKLHCLFYDKVIPDCTPKTDAEEMKKLYEKRFSEIAERYGNGVMYDVEVINELLQTHYWTTNSVISDAKDSLEWSFGLAEKYFPNNQLGINEHTGLCWMDRCRATDKYYSYIEANMLKGARIDAIGMQYHLFNKREDEYEKTRLTLNPESLYRHMDLYSNFGKPLQITEVTVPAYSWASEDEEIQAEIIEKLYSIWFSHPNVEQIIYWNLVDGYAHLWNPDPEEIKASQGNMSLGENYYYGGLLRFDLSPKPAYYTIKNLIQNVWHTEETLVTSEKGTCSFRGFYGEYELEFDEDGKTMKKTVFLSSKDDNEIKVVL